MDIAPAGRRYADAVPDTLDLADRATLGVHGIGGTIDPDLLTMWGLIHYAVKRPHLAHWASAETRVRPQAGRVVLPPAHRVRQHRASRPRVQLPRGHPLPHRRRTVLGPLQPQAPLAQLVLPRLLLWQPAATKTSRAPPVPPASCAPCLSGCEMGWQPSRMEEMLRSLAAGLRRIAVVKDDYAYYPEKGGWSEPCAYPRSGWLNTDEARSDTDGGEGSIVCMHGHQIYAAARWYALTGDPTALDLAARLARYVMKPKFWGGVPDSRADRTGLLEPSGASRTGPGLHRGLGARPLVQPRPRPRHRTSRHSRIRRGRRRRPRGRVRPPGVRVYPQPGHRPHRLDQLLPRGPRHGGRLRSGRPRRHGYPPVRPRPGRLLGRRGRRHAQPPRRAAADERRAPSPRVARTPTS